MVSRQRKNSCNSLGRQSLIRESVRPKQPHHCVSKQVWILPAVESPLKFIEVTIQMLRGDLMIGAHNRPLEQAPNAFHGIGVNIATDPFFFVVIDRLVLRVVIRDAAIGGPLVGHDSRSLGEGILLDEFVERLSVISPLDSEPNVSTPLDSTEHHRLVGPVSLVAHVPPMPADVRLVHFNRSLERSRVRFLHRLTDAVAEIPGRLV